MIGRTKLQNDIYYTCSLIEYIARCTHNTNTDIIDYLGDSLLFKIYDLADVYHCDDIHRVCIDFCVEADIQKGDFINFKDTSRYTPSIWEIGGIFQRLVCNILDEDTTDIIEAFKLAYNSFVTALINDYDCSFYCDSPHRIYYFHKEGTLEVKID